MTKLVTVSSVIVTALLANTVATAQPQEPRTYVRINCVKVRDGKGQEYAAYLRDVNVKLAKVRLEAAGSNMSAYTIAQAVAPTGRSARCDYQIVTSYTGFPPEAPTLEQTTADLKKAGISMSREAVIAKRDELTYLVGT